MNRKSYFAWETIGFANTFLRQQIMTKPKQKTLKYYEWDDIEKFLSKQLGIKPNEFDDDYFQVFFDRFDNGYGLRGYRQIIIDDNEVHGRHLEKWGQLAVKLGKALDALRDELGTYELYINFKW